MRVIWRVRDALRGGSSHGRTRVSLPHAARHFNTCGPHIRDFQIISDARAGGPFWRPAKMALDTSLQDALYSHRQPSLVRGPTLLKEMALMATSFRNMRGDVRGGPGIGAPIVRRLRAPLGTVVPGRSVPISFFVRVRGPARR